MSENQPSDEPAATMDNTKELEGIREIMLKTIDDLHQQLDCFKSVLFNIKMKVDVSNKRKHSTDDLTTGINRGKRINTDDLRNRPGTSKEDIGRNESNFTLNGLSETERLKTAMPDGTDRQLPMFLRILNSTPKSPLKPVSFKTLDKSKTYKVILITKVTSVNKVRIMVTLENAPATYLPFHLRKTIIENDMLEELQDLAKNNTLFIKFDKDGVLRFDING